MGVAMRVDPTDGRITTQEQATFVVREFCRKAVEARDKCNIVIPGDHQATVDAQRKMYDDWLMFYGAAVGALNCLHRAGLISDNAFQLLMPEVMATIRPTVVGDLSNPAPSKGGLVLV